MSHRSNTIAKLTLGLALCFGANMAQASTEQYYGRWTVSDKKPAYSAKGRLYKMIDVAPCGKDFCGISVADDNSCGKTLFRFLTTHASDEELSGHGLWGTAKKKLQMGYAKPDNKKPYIYVALGSDDMDITGREGSLPTFEANYKNAGTASCLAK